MAFAFYISLDKGQLTGEKKDNCRSSRTIIFPPARDQLTKADFWRDPNSFQVGGFERKNVHVC